MGNRTRAGARKQQNIKAATTTTMVVVEARSGGNLPEEMMHEILLKLPVKPLTRLKAVCKKWCALISDPHFVKLHVTLSNRNHNVRRLHVSSWSFSLAYTNSEPSEIQIVEIDYPFRYPPDCIEVLGSCNGLLLIGARSGETFLWNPTLKEHTMLLPKSDLWESHDYGNRYLSGHKLGYVSSLDEYKVVIFSFESNGKHHGHGVIISLFVFSSRTGCWKEVTADKGFSYSIFPAWSKGLTLNGCPHWLKSEYDEIADFMKPNGLNYFDMMDEKFKRVPTPTSLWKLWKYASNVEMVVLGGCLSTAHLNEEDRSFDVWMMKEYGVKESWTKLFSCHCSVFSSCHCLAFPFHANFLIPLGFTKNGDEVVLEINKRALVTYNLKTNEANFVLGTRNKYEEFCSVEYVESLVSPLALVQRQDKKEHMVRVENKRFMMLTPDIVQCPPEKGALIFSVNGSSLGKPGDAGIGGVLRDNRGYILCIFSCPVVGVLDSNEAETLAIRKALKLFEHSQWRGWRNLIIEHDSLVVSRWLNDRVHSRRKLLSVFNEIENSIRNIGKVSFQYILSQENQMADGFAKMGIGRSSDWCAWV